MRKNAKQIGREKKKKSNVSQMEREGGRCRTSSRNTGLDGDTLLIRWQSGEGELISDAGELVSKVGCHKMAFAED